ncbi:MAG: class I SAM-dependent methyltransferase [Oscillospiraceae bacterium]|nr:class I SAM-dependent methyltransferase [Oscillospiraceae bacterium]
MNYIQTNKTAWEKAFDSRKPNWGDDNHTRLKNDELAFFNSDLKERLKSMDFTGKKIAQFCCNNGRELLSLVSDSGAEAGVGFDIAENIIEQAKQTAEKAGIRNCEFVSCNILEVPGSFYNQFDFIFFTIGALCWVEDLTPLFEKVSKCLKDSGLLLINDSHPFMMMLPFPEDDEFIPGEPNRLAFSYFRKEPWTGNRMDYISNESLSETFTDFSHTLSDIINALSANGLKTVTFNEYEYDINGSMGIYEHKGFPLSYILTAEKC